MSDEQKPPSSVAPTTADSGDTPATTTSGEKTEPEVKAGAQSTGFHFTADPSVPEWAVGKTPQELLGITTQLYNQMLRGNPATQSASPQMQQQQPQQQPTQSWGQPAMAPPTQEEWDTNYQAAVQKQIAYEKVTTFEPMFQRTSATLADQARGLAELRHPDAFKKYGPEISVMLSQLPPDQLTTFAIDKVVGMVKADHIDDIVSERLEREKQKMMDSGALLRPGTSHVPTAAAPNGLDLNQLPDSMKRNFERIGVRENDIEDFLRGPAGALYGATLPERLQNFLELSTKGDIITEQSLTGNKTVYTEGHNG